VHVGFNVPIDTYITGYFGADNSLQAINCTGTDNQRQGNRTLHTPETQKTNRKTYCD